LLVQVPPSPPASPAPELPLDPEPLPDPELPLDPEEPELPLDPELSLAASDLSLAASPEPELLLEQPAAESMVHTATSGQTARRIGFMAGSSVGKSLMATGRQRRVVDQGLASGRERARCPPPYDATGMAGTRPWRSMTSATFGGGGGPAAASPASSRKNFGPIFAGVSTLRNRAGESCRFAK
jgi:hypothetical protein